MDAAKLFEDLLHAPQEEEVMKILDRYGLKVDPTKWAPYGDTESNYAIVENQQDHAVPALVEKITNGIDAILERRCLEEGIDPRSPEAPRSVTAAIEKFFPGHRNWDLLEKRREQAADLQIVADGPKNNTSLLIYDNGVGQHPKDFPHTFLSLVRGNKNDVHFVQGRYNMGGAGAIAFCGKHRFQLVASRRFDGDDKIGFTLIRRHPLTAEEDFKRKSTWYEYLFINGRVPSFSTEKINVGLYGRHFDKGSLIKLYSYRLPAGVRSVISRDLNLSLNEYLFEPALPFLTVDKKERYPNNKALVTQVAGLHRRLEEDEETIEARFSLDSETEEFGSLGVRVYVFKARARNQRVKESKAYIQREYFKNNMSVLFSVNGQVQGHYTSEFVTRALKLNLLRDYVLIHVDCSKLKTEVRNELFMASRDRLKRSETNDALRTHLRKLLDDSELKVIAKRRRASLGADGADAAELVRNITKRMPMNPELTRLLKQTFEIPDDRPGEQQKAGTKPPKGSGKLGPSTKDKPEFDPQRYPSIFNLQGGDGHDGEMTLFHLPKGGSRTIRFSTDVEDRYFDRTDDAGEMQVDVLRPGGEGERSGTGEAGMGRHDRFLDVVKSSPSNGQIRVTISAQDEVEIGDAIEVRATLSTTGELLEQIFMVRVSQPESPKPVKTQQQPEPKLGLPKLVLVTKEGGNGRKSFEEIETMGVSMSFDNVVRILSDEDQLSEIVINLDSHVFQRFRTTLKSTEAYEFAENRYISAVYFHCIFLYATTTGRNYELRRGSDDIGRADVDVGDYISDLFEQSYAQFLLYFDTSELIEAIS